MNPQRDFLQIPDGEAVTITLKYNTGLLRNGQFGKYFVYTIIHESAEKLLKVSERLEKQFRKADVQGGQEIQLRKDSITPKEGEPYGVINLVSDSGLPTPLHERQNTQLALLNESTAEMQLLNESLNDASTICKNLQDTTVIPEVTLAVGLFLARTIRATMIPLNGQGNHRPRRPDRKPKPATVPDKEPVATTVKKDDDLPF